MVAFQSNGIAVPLGPCIALKVSRDEALLGPNHDSMLTTCLLSIGGCSGDMGTQSHRTTYVIIRATNHVFKALAKFGGTQNEQRNAFL